MSEHLLNHPYVSAMIEQVGSERVSKQLRIQVETNPEPNSHYDPPDGYGPHRLFADG
jgi:hypothetical protein